MRAREKKTTRTATAAASGMASLVIVITLIVLIGNTPGSCAELVGKILNSQGEPISGVDVHVMNAAGVEVIGTSDAHGDYSISHLKPGIYKLAPSGPLLALPSQWVMSYIGDRGLTVNWGFPPHAMPVAVARLGTDSDKSIATSASPPKISPMRNLREGSGDGSGINN